MQRLRITFRRGNELKYLSHLDMVRLWERALRRSDIALAYSQGFHPHPRISIAVPMPVGVTGDGELMDIWITRKASPYTLVKVVSAQLPQGIGILNVAPVALQLPSLQSIARYAEYRVDMDTDKDCQAVDGSIQSLMERSELSWKHQRDGETRYYNLRALVKLLWVVGWNGPRCTLGMILKTDSEAAGRAEQVALALGFDEPPVSIHRSRLFLVGDIIDC